MPFMRWSGLCPDADYELLADYLKAYACCAFVDEAEFASSGFCHVQYPSFDERATVIDAQHNAFAIAHILDFDFLAKPDAAVCRCHLCWVGIFAGSCF